MRKLNSDEINLLNSDLIPFEIFLKTNGLLSDKVSSKYEGINFHIESKQELGGANGVARINSQTRKRDIAILDTAMTNDRLRSNICYHELGHALMGMTSYERADLEEKVLKHIVEIKKKHPNELTESIHTYLSGFSCLEEYLVEKFAQSMQVQCKKINVPKKQNYSCPSICADYNYWSTIDTKYGIFETICDELAGKTFGDLSTTIRAGLNEKYFGTFFDRFDEKEIMTILGNLGQVFQSIMNYAGNSISQYNEYSPYKIKQTLVDTEQLVKNIQPKVQEINSHRRL